MLASGWTKKCSIKVHYSSKYPGRALSLLGDKTATHTTAQPQESEQAHHYHNTGTQNTAELGVPTANRKLRYFSTRTGGKVRMGREPATILPPLREWEQEVFGKGRRQQHAVEGNWYLFLGTKGIWEENVTPRGTSETQCLLTTSFSWLGLEVTNLAQNSLILGVIKM